MRPLRERGFVASLIKDTRAPVVEIGAGSCACLTLVLAARRLRILAIDRDAGAVADARQVLATIGVLDRAAVGFGHPERLLTRGGARPGDLLVLTKPLGTGAIVTACKRDQADPTHRDGAVRWMTALNRTASRVATELGLRAATDVTGFGLLGHAWEMAQASGVGLRLRLRDVPLMDGARKYAAQDLFPAGSRCNRDYYGPHVRFTPSIPEMEQMLLFDAQTAGGLLLAVPPDRLRRFLDRFTTEGRPGWVIGEVVMESGIAVVPE